MWGGGIPPLLQYRSKGSAVEVYGLQYKNGENGEV